ncbi:cytochrome P450 [Coniochaeta sp. PMI_546]|nr:cytochrome P450 [Coniochaeta sp. PMI_546]
MDSTLQQHLDAPITVRNSHISYWGALACVLFAVYIFRSSRNADPVNAPFYKAGRLKWMTDAENLVRDSYNKYYNRVYKIKATEGIQVLIPPKYLDELRNLPEDTLSSTEALREAMLSKYTGFCPGHNAELLSTLIRTKLTQNLARLVPQLKGELEYVVGTEFPECREWTSVKLQPFVVRAVARMSGHAFVGPALSRNEEWMDTSINYAVHVFLAAVQLQFFPDWMRPVAQYLVPHLRYVNRDIAAAERMVQPILEQRLRDMDTPGFDAQKPDDFCQWLLESLPEAEKAEIRVQAHLQLIVSAAAIHTTTNLAVDCLFDLAAYPDVQEELRQEVYEVLECDDGWSKKESMSKLKKMDSFIKEVQRFAGNVTAFIRKVIKPIDLSDGTHLPPGTKLLTPLAGICRDGHFYSDPDTFDALRFYRLRQQSADDANRHQFTAMGDSVNMHFGAGKHACPGRFFAGNAIKMMLAYFLLNYDLKLKEGEARPKSMMVMMSKTPNPKAEILFRRRTAAA